MIILYLAIATGNHKAINNIQSELFFTGSDLTKYTFKTALARNIKNSEIQRCINEILDG